MSSTTIAGLVTTSVLTGIWVALVTSVLKIKGAFRRRILILLGACWLFFLCAYFLNTDNIIFTERAWRIIFFATTPIAVCLIVAGTPQEWYKYFIIVFSLTGLSQIKWVDVPLPEIANGAAALLFLVGYTYGPSVIGSIGASILSTMFLALMKMAGCDNILFMIFYIIHMIGMIVVILIGPLNERPLTQNRNSYYRINNNI